MVKAIGIDLGTTNSVAAFKLVEVEVVTANDNTPPDRKLTRSVVAENEGQFLVGEQAYNQLRHDPENVIISIKRLMGRGFGDVAVQKQKSEFDYKIGLPSQGTDNSLAVWLGEEEYQPEDISAEILKKVVHNAQNYCREIGQSGEVVEQVVITIPAYFNDKQRYATRTAALKAGLTPLELLPEPTAAAISYGFSPDSDDVKTILVYDFGGGTFDASVITAGGKSFIEQGKAGDLWLGGDDIDSRLIQFFKEQVSQKENIVDIENLIAQTPYYQQLRFHADLKIAVERAKVELTEDTVTRIIPGTQLLDDLGIAIPLDVEITREQFENIIDDLVERSLQICHQALEYAEYSLDMLDIVLLVGGSSQIPIVQNKLKQAFGEQKVVLHPQPMYAVAEGAAIVAAGQTDKVTTVSRDYFIELADGPYKVINQGDILPVQTPIYTFKTVVEGQRLIHFQFFSPDQVKEKLDGTTHHERIGEMWLGLDQKYPVGTEFQVNLELDEQNNDLRMTATLKNDPSVRVSCVFSRGRADEKIYQELENGIKELNDQSLTAYGVEEALKLAVPVVKSANQIINPITGEENQDVMIQAQENLQKFRVNMSSERLEAESLVGECDRILKLCQFMILKPQQEKLQQLSQELQSAIDDNNPAGMKFYSEETRQEMIRLPEEVQVVQACIIAIQQAKVIAPTQANAMSDKLSRLLMAMNNGDVKEAERLLPELQPEVEHWLNQEIPTNNIVTGLKR
ncbi:MAG: Hsp70 family protein [Sphaerospermopsis sp. SIO1G1]|nr:Hsp70 family protein [Sphaerospermopsis sp. SIO1G1]